MRLSYEIMYHMTQRYKSTLRVGCTRIGDYIVHWLKANFKSTEALHLSLFMSLSLPLTQNIRERVGLSVLHLKWIILQNFNERF
jgi:hypothetical protein